MGSFDLETGIGGMCYDVDGEKGRRINADWTAKKFNRKCKNVAPGEVFYQYNKYVMENVRVGGSRRNPVMGMREFREDTIDVRFIPAENKIIYSDSHPL